VIAIAGEGGGRFLSPPSVYAILKKLHKPLRREEEKDLDKTGRDGDLEGRPS